MYAVMVLMVFCVTVTFSATENVVTDSDLGEDVISCLRDSNITYKEVSEMELFNPNKTIPHNAKCFAACVLSTDYNVSASSEGVVEKVGLLLDAVMQDTEMDLKNATEVVDVCKKIITAKFDRCENLYNYAICVNQKYFEKKGLSNFTGIIVEQHTLENQISASAEGFSNVSFASPTAPSSTP